MGRLYDEQTTGSEARGWRTECQVDDDVVAVYVSPPWTSREKHDEQLEPVVASVFDAWGICPECMGSGEGELIGDELHPCHCVAESRAEDVAADAAWDREHADCYDCSMLGGEKWT
jgi:hypothetical protein